MTVRFSGYLAALMVAWCWLGAPGGAEAQTGETASRIVQWEFPPSRDCVLAECPRFIPTEAGEEGTVTQGILFGVLLPIPGELIIPTAGEFPVIRRIGTMAETLVFLGPASIFLHSDGSYEFISPGGGASGEESHPHSLLPHGLPPVIAGVEGTRFDYLITPQGQVYVRVASGLVRVRWWQEDWQETLLRGGEAVLVDPHEYGGIQVDRQCSPGSDGTCGRIRVRRFFGEEADSRWNGLKVRLDSRASRGWGARQVLQQFDQALEDLAGQDTLTPAEVETLFAAFTDLLIPCTPSEIAAAATRFASFLPGHVISVHAIYLAWLKARVRGELGISDRLYIYLAGSRNAGPWEGLVSIPAIIDSPLEIEVEPGSSPLLYDLNRVLLDPGQAPPVSK